jgi:dTDP-glucose 4,6-dehydratase
VHISSAEIFGSTDAPATEETLFNPSTPYAVSKAAADMYLNVLQKNFGFPALIIRSTNVYGAYQQLFKIIPRTVIRVKTGEQIELHGGGTSMKSFIHIRDVVRGLVMALDQGALGTFHFTVQSDRTVADVVRTVVEQMGADYDEVVTVVGERLGQDSAYTLSTEKAERELGWAPQEMFDDGVRETIDWIESNWEAVQAEPHVYVHKV